MGNASTQTNVLDIEHYDLSDNDLRKAEKIFEHTTQFCDDLIRERAEVYHKACIQYEKDLLKYTKGEGKKPNPVKNPTSINKRLEITKKWFEAGFLPLEAARLILIHFNSFVSADDIETATKIKNKIDKSFEESEKPRRGRIPLNAKRDKIITSWYRAEISTVIIQTLMMIFIEPDSIRNYQKEPITVSNICRIVADKSRWDCEPSLQERFVNTKKRLKKSIKDAQSSSDRVFNNVRTRLKAELQHLKNKNKNKPLDEKIVQDVCKKYFNDSTKDLNDYNEAQSKKHYSSFVQKYTKTNE